MPQVAANSERGHRARRDLQLSNNPGRAGAHPYRALPRQRVTSPVRLPHFEKSPGGSCRLESDKCKLRKGYSILRNPEWI